jgi:prolyl-tRNA synthetase
VIADSGQYRWQHLARVHVLADSGEDAIAFSDDSDYAANVELAETVDQRDQRPASSEKLRSVDTPGVRKTIADACSDGHRGTSRR